MLSVCELGIIRLEESVALPVEDGDAKQDIVTTVIMDGDFAHVVRLGHHEFRGGVDFEERKLVTGAICSREGVEDGEGVDYFDVVGEAELGVQGEYVVVGVLGRVGDQLREAHEVVILSLNLIVKHFVSVGLARAINSFTIAIKSI